MGYWEEYFNDMDYLWAIGHRTEATLMWFAYLDYLDWLDWVNGY